MPPARKNISPTKKRNPLKRPFRGTLRKGDIQTIDVGANDGAYVINRAAKMNADDYPHAKRVYAAVEPNLLLPHTNFKDQRFPTDPINRQFIIEYNRRIKQGYNRMKTFKNIQMIMYDVVPYFRELSLKGKRTRHVSINMPFPKLELYDFENFFRLLPKVIYPGGKVFITSESRLFLEQIVQISREITVVDESKKLLKKPRALPIVEVKPEELLHRGPNDMMKRYGREGKKIYRLVLVVPPKK